MATKDGEGIHKNLGILTVGHVNAVEIRPGPMLPGHTLTLGGPGDTVAVGPGAQAIGFTPANDQDLSHLETIIKSEADDEATLITANEYTDSQVGTINVPLDPKGTFGTTSGDLPAIAVSGDAYWCEEDNYVSVNGGFTAQRADMAIWTSGWSLIPSSSAEYANKTFNETITGNWTFNKNITAARAPTINSHLTNKAFVDSNLAIMLGAANNYSDWLFSQSPEPDLTPFITTIDSELHDIAVLRESKEYTDAELIPYETIVKSKAEDAVILNTSKAYTDDQIAAYAPDLTGYETIVKSEQEDADTLQASKSYTDAELIPYETIVKSEDDDADTLDASKTYTDDQIAAIPTPVFTPIGLISMWSGNDARDLSALSEKGWYLCDDGTHATGHPEVARVPDLTGKFVYGGALGVNIGTEGGSSVSGNTTLSEAQMPSHSHSGTTSSHSHAHGPQQAESGGTGGSYEKRKRQIIHSHDGQPGSYNQYVGSGGSSFTSVTFGTSNWYTDYQAHTHSITMGSSGSSNSHNHTIDPPYYTVAYVIYLGVI